MNLLNLVIWVGLDFDFANWAFGVFKNFGFFSLCNNYIFDCLYLIHLFSLDSGFICCLGELQVWK